MKRTALAFIPLLVFATAAFPQGIQTKTAPVQKLPTLRASIGFGFNYDVLTAPTDVSYDYARGYFGLNIPFKQTIAPLDVARNYGAATDDIFENDSIIRDGESFKPTASAKQNANTTVRVDVPMMGGVASFANTQNFSLRYENTLGNPDLYFVPDSMGPGLSLALRGTINVPLELSVGWESMMFGYAYRVNKYFSFGLNLHRHLFTFDLNGSINADIYGKLSYDASAAAGEEAASAGFSGAVIDVPIDYNSQKVNGIARGHYEAEAWSPAIGFELWRFVWTSRFGVDTRAKGELLAQYALPFFIDPQTFGTTVNFDSTGEIIGNMNKFISNATDSIKYHSTSDLRWKLPQGHTLAFYIVPKHLSLSYTKLFGEVALLLPDIKTVHSGSDSIRPEETVSMDVGVTVDHVIMISGSWPNIYFNLGIFTMDFRTQGRTHLMGNALGPELSWLKLGKSPMMPVLNIGSAIGSKMQILLELDVLPLPAVKAGVRYYFG